MNVLTLFPATYAAPINCTEFQPHARGVGVGMKILFAPQYCHTLDSKEVKILEVFCCSFFSVLVVPNKGIDESKHISLFVEFR